MDIFISYKSDERSVAKQLATKLTEAGYSVWWDNALLAGDRFQREIQQALDTSRAVIVLWSRRSIQSEWVQAEAERARRARKVIPVIIDDLPHTELPMLFNGLHAASLDAWDGGARHPGYKALLSAVRTRAGEPGPALTSRAADARLAETVKESEVWAEISHPDNHSIDDYRSYLTRFGPDGRFAELAKVRIARLERAPWRSWSIPRIPASIAIAAAALVGIATIGASLWMMLPQVMGTVAPATATATPHEDTDFGFALTVPPGMTKRSDGLYELNGALLTVLFGATHRDSFYRQVEHMQERAVSLSGTVTYQSKDSSHFSGYTSKNKDRIFYVGAVPLCAGLNYGGFKLEYPTALRAQFDPMVDEITDSLHSSGWGRLCTLPRPMKGVVRAGDIGSTNLRMRPDSKSGTLAALPDGTPLQISSIQDAWYDVVAPGGQKGYVSRLSVKVDEYVDIGLERRFIQLVSYVDVDQAKAYVAKSNLALSVYLSANGWYAVSMAQTYTKEQAAAAVVTLKLNLKDAEPTFGNTYVKRICSKGANQPECI